LDFRGGALSDVPFEEESEAEIQLAAAIQPFPEMQPGEAQRVTLRYAPRDFGLDERTLVLRSDDTLSADAEVRVIGRGTPPEGCFMTLSATALDFGPVALGVTTTRRAIVANAGTAESCVIDRIDGP